MKYCYVIFMCMMICGQAYSQTAVPEKILEKKDVEYAYPRWSKDGNHILFQSNESGKWQICIMDANGKNIRQITNDPSNNNFIDWSPDNKKIAFVSDQKRGNICNGCKWRASKATHVHPLQKYSSLLDTERG